MTDTLVDESYILDDETLIAGRDAFRQLYAAAADIVATRLARKDRALVAAGPDEQVLTDEEWEDLVSEYTADEVGDALLDGIMAGAITFGVIGLPALVAVRAAQQLLGLVGYAPEIRLRLNDWAANLDESIGWDRAKIRAALAEKSPLDEITADQVAQTEMNGSANSGMFTALEEARPAALRWVTQRDLRVRAAHAAADQDTVPFGSMFSIGGYEARFPGDPMLPYALRVNCRCVLMPVEGTEVRRTVGSTVEELKAKASELNVATTGLNKGQLQFAVLKQLCLQGRAGGPDCPDLFEDMNRNALVALARGERIAGRHAMSRQQLIVALRRTLRGDDTLKVSSGYANRADFAAAQKRAAYKRGRAPQPTAEMAERAAIPSPADRRSFRAPLFRQFGGEQRGFVPCVHCGLRLTDDASTGMAMIVPEPIVPWSDGGVNTLSNMLPACASCFAVRGGVGGAL